MYPAVTPHSLHNGRLDTLGRAATNLGGRVEPLAEIHLRVLKRRAREGDEILPTTATPVAPQTRLLRCDPVNRATPHAHQDIAPTNRLEVGDSRLAGRYCCIRSNSHSVSAWSFMTGLVHQYALCKNNVCLCFTNQPVTP